jgi:hypothetical protein
VVPGIVQRIRTSPPAKENAMSPKNLTRTARRALVGLGLVVASVVGVVGPANAVTWTSSGAVGPSYTPQIDCRHKIYGTTGVLQMTAPAPTVYARDYRAGAGNDGAYVRYVAYLMDARTRAILASTAYSGWSYAYDNRPAAFSGAAQFSPDWRGSYLIGYGIEWWAPGGSAPLGATFQTSDRYFYVASNTVAGGVWQTCMKMY